jgi:hypothetical protein
MSHGAVRKQPDRRQGTARTLRRLSLFTDGATAMAALVNREDAVACTGALSAALRCAAELLEGPSQR